MTLTAVDINVYNSEFLSRNRPEVKKILRKNSNGFHSFELSFESLKD